MRIENTSGRTPKWAYNYIRLHCKLSEWVAPRTKATDTDAKTSHLEKMCCIGWFNYMQQVSFKNPKVLRVPHVQCQQAQKTKAETKSRDRTARLGEYRAPTQTDYEVQGTEKTIKTEKNLKLVQLD